MCHNERARRLGPGGEHRSVFGEDCRLFIVRAMGGLQHHLASTIFQNRQALRQRRLSLL